MGAETETKKLYLATWGERVAAWVVDVLIVAVVAILFFRIVAVVLPFLDYPSFQAYPRFGRYRGFGPSFPFLLSPVLTIFEPWFFGWVFGVWFFLYWAVTEGMWGQSIGKKIFGLKITNLRGEPAGFGKATLESLGKAFMLVLDLVIGLLIPDGRDKRQRLTNYLSGTIVVRIKPPAGVELKVEYV